MAEKITIALDWTPNTNHTGFYVARAKGWYQDAGLDVSMLSPHLDEYKATPASRVQDGTATFAITPKETVVSYHTWPDGSKPKLKAVAALLAVSTSAIVTTKESGIDRAAKLDGKVYASYGARYEGRIVQRMIQKDGGTGDYVEETMPMLGIWNTLLAGKADATWIFEGWEGVEARRSGVELNWFRPETYGVPYGYSPVVVADPATLEARGDAVTKFLQATARGFEFAKVSPKEAAEIFFDEVAKDVAETAPLPTPLEKDMCVESQEYLSTKLVKPDSRWGTMSLENWNAWLDWLDAEGLLTTKVQSRKPVEGTSTTLDGLRAGDVGDRIPRESLPAEALFTNDFLPVYAQC